MQNVFTTVVKYPILLIVLFIIATRIPQLLSPHLLLDPDECVTAIMAKYMLENKDFSLFFLGQKYGFAIVETSIIAVFYSFLGINTIAVKLAMLSLWTMGVLLYHKVFLNISKDQHKALIFSLLFVCLPAWAVWSMKARGGYLTAFCTSAAIFYLLFEFRFLHQKIVWLLIGILIAIVYESQSLWLVGVLPLLVFQMMQHKKTTKLLLLIFGFAIIFIACEIYKQNIIVAYIPPTHLPDFGSIGCLTNRLPSYILKSFTGYYYFDTYYTADSSSQICAGIMFGLIVVLLLVGIRQFIFHRKQNALFIFSTIFIIGFWAANLFFPKTEGRYLLPLTEFAILSLCIATANKKITKTEWRMGTAIVGIGLVSLIPFYQFEFLVGRKKELSDIMDILKKNKTAYSYSADCMLPWHLAFYSSEALLSRNPYYNGRNKAYDLAVDSNWQHGGRCAIIGIKNERPKNKDSSYILLNEFFVQLQPTQDDFNTIFYPAK